MTDEIKKLTEELGNTFEQFKQQQDKINKGLATNESVDVLVKEHAEKLNARITEIEAQKQALEAKVSKMNRSAPSESDSKLAEKARDFAKVLEKRRGSTVGEFGADELKAYEQAFEQHLRKGDLAGLDVQKALSVGSDQDGGYVVTPDTSGRIVNKIFETSPMRQFSSVQMISTDALEGLFDLNEAGAGWVSETGSRTETTTPQLGQWRIPVHELYAEPQATQKILDDASINIEQWLSMKVADKLSRTENAAFVNGTGVGQPRGFLTYAAGTTLPGTIQQLETGVNGAFAAAPNGGDKILELIYNLKAPYRNNARFFTNRLTLAEARKLKDSNGAYIWQPGLAAGQPSTLAGYAVAELEDMPALAAGSLSMAFGDMREAYQIVDRAGIRVLRDPYTNKPYVKFYTTKRVGGDVVNFEAIKLLKFTA